MGAIPSPIPTAAMRIAPVFWMVVSCMGCLYSSRKETIRNEKRTHYVPSRVMNLVIPNQIINIENCNGPYNNSEGEDDRDMIRTSTSLGSANINPYIDRYSKNAHTHINQPFLWTIRSTSHIISSSYLIKQL